MISLNQPNQEIIKFIIREVDKHPHDIATLTAEHFGVTRVTACRYLQRLVAEQQLIAKGTTKARQYKLRDLVDEIFMFRVTPQTQDDELWRLKIAALLKGVPKNTLDICQYGVTEILNNVIVHSQSDTCSLQVKRNAKRIVLKIQDYGVGIFNHICNGFHLENAHHALLELIKGKLTTAPETHKGEGIFFTSRLFSECSIYSGKLLFQQNKQAQGWYVRMEDSVQNINGTIVELILNLEDEQTLKEILDQYIDNNGNFTRTHIPVFLAQDGGELISRSQAKRVLQRCENFKELVLDFKDVSQAGEAFLDEIFRVYPKSHPYLKIIPVNTNPTLQKLIKHVRVS